MNNEAIIFLLLSNLILASILFIRTKVAKVTPKSDKSVKQELPFLKPYGKQSGKKKPIVNDDEKAFEKEHQ